MTEQSDGRVDDFIEEIMEFMWYRGDSHEEGKLRESIDKLLYDDVCCADLRVYRSVMDNVRMSVYDTDTKEMVVTTHEDRYPFTFCPFCGTSQFFVVR